MTTSNLPVTVTGYGRQLNRETKVFGLRGKYGCKAET
jgi:hypothetical protein